MAELAALVPSTSNVEHYARIVKEMSTAPRLVRAGHEITRLGQERPGEVTDLVDRAEQIVFELGQQRATSDFAHIEILLKESFERITQLYEAGAEITGIPAGFRELDSSPRLPAGEPRDPRRPTVDGEVGARPLHRRQPRRAPRDASRPVHARDVQVRGDPADDVQRGQGRVAAAAHGSPRPGRLAAADDGLRPADESADLRRRLARRRSWSCARRPVGSSPGSPTWASSSSTTSSS